MFKKAFTLLEIIVVIFIVGIGFLGSFSVINYSYKFLKQTKAKLIAINIARGGVESVFTIRNSNWQRRGGKKDKCWLKINPLVDDNTDGCEDDDWFGTGNYFVGVTGEHQKYFYLSGNSLSPLNLTGNIRGNDREYLVCNNTGIIASCNLKPDDYFANELYFQQVRGGYLLDKDNNSKKDCNSGNDSGCGDGKFLEKNFCVDVVYISKGKKDLTFCSSLTNFKD